MYTIIAYSPSGSDYCQGCLMGTRESDFEVNSYEDDEIADAVEQWISYEEANAVALKNNRYLPEFDWELTLLFNGEESECSKFKALLEGARVEHKRKKAEQAKKEKAAAARRKEREAAVKEQGRIQRDLAELARLKKEYE